MGKISCPGQSTIFWKPEDIFEISCPACNCFLEFFKDDASRRCSFCGTLVVNPKLNVGCAKWCKSASQCLGFDLLADNVRDSFVSDLLNKFKGILWKNDDEKEKIYLRVAYLKELINSFKGETLLNYKLLLFLTILLDIEDHQTENILEKVGIEYNLRSKIKSLLVGNEKLDGKELLIWEKIKKKFLERIV